MILYGPNIVMQVSTLTKSQPGLTISHRRSCDLVEIMHNLGLLYDRVLSISTDLGNAVCCRYQDEDVCPCNLRLNLFTTAAVYTIDDNPSSKTAQDSFHGTGTSLLQDTANEIPGSVNI